MGCLYTFLPLKHHHSFQSLPSNKTHNPTLLTLHSQHSNARLQPTKPKSWSLVVAQNSSNSNGGGNPNAEKQEPKSKSTSATQKKNNGLLPDSETNDVGKNKRSNAFWDSFKEGNGGDVEEIGPIRVSLSDLLDLDPDNMLTVGLVGLLMWATAQIFWQLFFVSLAIAVAAIKYSLIAAILLFILVTLL